MAITPFSAVPSRATGQDTFSADVETFWGQLPTFVNEVNAFGAGLSSQITTSSTTSLLVGTGSKTLTVGTSLGFQVGYPVRIAYSDSIYMTGTVTTYNPATGELICNIASVSGSGTYAVWAVYAIPASITNVPDGDKGDITVSGSGATWTIDNDVVSFAKIQNIATSRILGRTTASSGDIEELTVGDRLTLTGGALNATAYPITNGTSTTASGTAIDFTGMPSWVKRITVMLNGVSTNGTSAVQVQLGSGSISTSGYTSSGADIVAAGATGGSTSTSGLILERPNNVGASGLRNYICTLVNISGNIWIASNVGISGAISILGGGVISLGGVLDRVRVTTVNGIDTFDAGSINILYE